MTRLSSQAHLALEIARLEPRNGYTGICLMLYYVTGADCIKAVHDCLADGFLYYSGNALYPIKPMLTNEYWAYKRGIHRHSLWSRWTPYGRRRHAALAFIKDRANRFYLSEKGNELRYWPCE